MTAKLFTLPKQVPFTNAGALMPGALANFYVKTTSTRQDTFTTSALSVAHDNPVVADAYGQFPVVYLDGTLSYKLVVTDSNGIERYTEDDFDPASTAAGISIVDVGGHYSGTTVEGALSQIGTDYQKVEGAQNVLGNQTYSGDNNHQDNTIQRPEIMDYSITHTDVTQSTATPDFDISLGNSFYVRLTENATFSLSSPSPLSKLCSIQIQVQQDGSAGAYTVSWPAAVIWPGGSAPVITTSNDAVDLVTLTTIDNGTTWLGNFSQAYA